MGKATLTVIYLIVFALAVWSGTVVFNYFIKSQLDSCSSNPLDYYSKDMLNTYPTINHVLGSVELITSKGDYTHLDFGKSRFNLSVNGSVELITSKGDYTHLDFGKSRFNLSVK